MGPSRCWPRHRNLRRLGNCKRSCRAPAQPLAGVFAWWILGAAPLGDAGGAAWAYWQPVSNPLAAAATAANRGEDPLPRKASARTIRIRFFPSRAQGTGRLAVREYFENQAGTENLVDPENPHVLPPRRRTTR